MTTPLPLPLRPRKWQVFLDDELMAELFFEDYESFVITVSVKEQASFAPFRRYFLDSAWDGDDADPELEWLLTEVRRRGKFELRPDEGPPTREFTLHIQGEWGSLRY